MPAAALATRIRERDTAQAAVESTYPQSGPTAAATEAKQAKSVLGRLLSAYESTVGEVL